MPFLLLFTLASSVAVAQARPLPMSEKPDAFLREFAETRRFQSGRPVQPAIAPDEKSVFFLRAQSRSPVQALFHFDVATGKTRELLNAETLLAGAEESLSAEAKAQLERQRISARGFTRFELSEDGASLLVSLSGKPYVYALATGKAQALKPGPGAILDARFSPDGKQVSYVRNFDLHTLDLATGKERALTRGGSSQKRHGLAEFIAQEEMSRFIGHWWSPDAKHLAYAEVDNSGMEEWSIVDPMHPEKGAEVFAYPRAGTANAKVRLGLIKASGGSTLWVDWDREAYPYLATVRWPKKGPLTVLVQNRAQTKELLLAVDERTGKTRTLLEEEDAAWINLEQAFPHWLEDGTGFLWFTERNGGPEIELRHPDGKRVRSLVKQESGFLALVGYDGLSRTLYFLGGPDPTQSLLFRVKDGGKPERVNTGSKGPVHETAKLSKNAQLLVVSSQSLSAMPQTHVQTVEGERLGRLPSVAVEPSLQARTQLLQVGPLRFHASVTKPRSFVPGKKLPVILEVYGGPTHTKVRHQLAGYLLAQWMADQGFLVVMVDGRGTPGRGHDWERAVHLNFAGVPLTDSVEGLRALAQHVPEMDLNRVGVTGWSFGGYLSALAALQRSDVFKAAVAGAPVVDWRDYDTHYTERYLGTPQEQPEAYEKSSLLSSASTLACPLLLIHGTADDNVYFFHTLKLSDALFRAGKPHDLLPLSGLTHMVPDPLVTERQWQRVMAYFRQHLGQG